MSSAATRTFGKAVAQRIRGDNPGRVQAFMAAAVAGVAAAALTYRALRSGA